MFTQHDGYDYIIVSDLHASLGADPTTGAVNPNEEFLNDAAFARFLDHLRERAGSEKRNWRLLVLGDLLDFLQADTGGESVPGRRFDADESGYAAITGRLDRIAAGHPELFGALGRFAAAGFPVDVMPGNHDIELLYPPAQERFRALVAAHSGRPEAPAGIRFFPWIYYVPGVFYAEHGHQYHDINWFPNMLGFYAPSSELEKGDSALSTQHSALPLTSQFHDYVRDVLEALGGGMGNGRSSIGALLRGVRRRPLAALSAWPHHVGFVKSLLRHMVSFSRPDVAVGRATYQAEFFPAHSAEVGLSYDTLAAIDDLAFTIASEIRVRLPRKLFVEPLLHWLPAIGATLATAGALYNARLRRGGPPGRPYAALVAGLAALSASLLWRGLRTWRFAPRTSDYAYRAARELHKVLRSARKGVPFYVLGHTHIAEALPLEKGASGPHYLNPGTWTAMVYPEPGTGKRAVRLTFVEITRESSGPAARLMLWDDEVGRVESAEC